MKKRRKPELLVPAGSMEPLIAAVENGADAVYVGGRLFNARMNAGNFDDERMQQALDYAHARGVKVFVTMDWEGGFTKSCRIFPCIFPLREPPAMGKRWRWRRSWATSGWCFLENCLWRRWKRLAGMGAWILRCSFTAPCASAIPDNAK